MPHTEKVPFHLISVQQTLKKLEINFATGLSTEEAQKRYEKYGPNSLPAKKEKTFLEKVWEQANSAIFYVLIVGAALSFGFDHHADGIVIICVVFVNISLGLFMEGKAENSTKNLANMMSVMAIVKRDEEKQEILAKEITIGDLVYLAPGDIVPADCRIIECAELEVLEAPLTGESHSIVKTTDIHIQTNKEDRITKIMRENSLISGTIDPGSPVFNISRTDSLTRSRSNSNLRSNSIIRSNSLIRSNSNISFRRPSISRAGSILSRSAIAIETQRSLTELSDYEFGSDLRLYCENSELKTDDITDEELGIKEYRDVPLAERTSMVYSGTQVIRGAAICAVVAIGSQCEMGKISQLINETKEEKTPLLVQLDNMAKVVSIIIIIIAFGTLGIAIGRKYEIADAFSIAIGVAVAAIPEGLPSCVTITFSIGVSLMADKGAIIKSLPSVETLGSVSVICSDKTGTLTLNKMTVIDIVTPTNSYELSPDGTLVNNEPTTNLIQKFIPAVICNDGSISTTEDEYSVQGEPTEICIMELACKLEGAKNVKDLIKKYPRKDVIPFDSAKKFMATMHEMSVQSFTELMGFEPNLQTSNGPIQVIFIKGASEKIIKFTQTGSNVQLWENKIALLASKGLRVLGTAYKIVPRFTDLTAELENPENFCLVSLLGIIDPPRPEAITAVETAHEAGITVKMITGDHPVTALAIGRQLGLRVEANSEAIVGSTLDKILEISDLEFDKIVLNNDIFARTTPEHKLKIVQSLQRQGIICSMTGDGVNDAPALKAANIGVAMGIMGTEVAKDAANMILTDDNFSTIIEAIRMGRTTYNNLLKILIFVFPTNGAQAFSIIIPLAIGIDVPITALQILWINMVTTICLGLVFAFEKPNPHIMQLPPRRPNKPIFGKFLSWRVLFVTIIMVCSVVGNFLWEKQRDLNDKQLYAVAVNTLYACQCFYLFNCRNLKENSFPKEMFTGNKYVWIGIIVTTGFQMLFTYCYPFQYIFDTDDLDATSWGKIVLFGFATFVAVELEKFFSFLRRFIYCSNIEVEQSKLAFEEL